MRYCWRCIDVICPLIVEIFTLKKGRQQAALMELVPKQHSSGSKQNLLGISKRSDTYLRTLMIHGVIPVIRVAENKAEPESWLKNLITRRNKNVTVAALAKKNARIIWALLSNARKFRPDYTLSAIVAGM